MTAEAQELSAEVKSFSLWPSLSFNEERGPESGNEIYIDAVIFDRVSRVRSETCAGQARENLTRALHPSLVAGRLRFDGYSVNVCIHMTNETISGIGNPPVPAIGTMDYLSENESDEQPTLSVTVYANPPSFDAFRKTLVDSELTKLPKRELLISVSKDLAEWDKQELVYVVDFSILVSSRNDAA